MPIVENDPFAPIKDIKKPQNAPDPTAVNTFHSRSDVDSSAQAQHHTLGVKHDQASPGDHKHDGRNSRKIMEGLTLTNASNPPTQTQVQQLINALRTYLGAS